LSLKKVGFEKFGFYLNYLEKPTDESDGYVYNPDDFKNPFGSQESTLSDNLFIGEAFAKIESATDAELPGKKEGSDDKVEVDAEEELEPDEIEEIIDDENEEEETKNLTFSERQGLTTAAFNNDYFFQICHLETLAVKILSTKLISPNSLLI